MPAQTAVEILEPWQIRSSPSRQVHSVEGIEEAVADSLKHARAAAGVDYNYMQPSHTKMGQENF